MDAFRTSRKEMNIERCFLELIGSTTVFFTDSLKAAMCHVFSFGAEVLEKKE